MQIELLTKEDLKEFKHELLDDLLKILTKDIDKPKRWLRTGEVRKLLDVSPGTLQNLRVNGTLKYSKIGTIIYYDSSDIEKLLREKKR